MTDERLRRAAVALERSVAELDAQRRLVELGHRHRRRRLTHLATAVVAFAAVLGGLVAAVQWRSGPEPARPAAAPPARVVASLPVPGTPVAAAVGAGGVWVAAVDADRVVRLDPATGQVLARVPVPPGPERLVVTPDAVWVLSPPNNTVTRIDPATNRRVATVPVGRQATGMALAAGSVWVSSNLDDTVTRIDAATNRVLASIPVGREPGAMAVAGGAVWVSLPQRGGLGRIDPAGNRLTLVPVRQCCVGELVGGERALWAANAWDGTLIRLDPISGRELARIALPRAAAQYPCWVVAGGGAVWVTSATTEVGAARQLWRVDPGTDRVSGSMSLGPASSRRIPDAPALDGTSLWVASGDSGAVLRLEPRP
jgi:virginiamycin B lyase